jgi:putative hydrolase of the HAD superfamily
MAQHDRPAEMAPMSGARPAAILFDAGGTLILQDPVEMSARLGLTIDPQMAHRAHYHAMAEYSDLRLRGEEADWDWWLERYFTLLEVTDPHLAGDRIQRGYALWNHPLDGVAAAIARLTHEGIRVAVVSNSDGTVRASLGRAGLLDLFEFVIDSHEAGVSKPNPGIFLAALERMGLAPDQAWYVGDSVFHDINGARVAGLAEAVLVDPYLLGPTDVTRVASVTELAPL